LSLEEGRSAVPIVAEPSDFNVADLYIDLRPIFSHPLFLKCEGFNFAGSIKLKAALEMVAAAEHSGSIGAGSVLVESSSGNLGIALAVIAASRGYRFLCITDPRCSAVARQSMLALGAEVRVVDSLDVNDGYLEARIDYVRKLCESDSRYVWLNQYANKNNWLAHYRSTAPEIERSFPDLDALFIGAGTTGTLMGCARYFRDRRAAVVIVAVDAVGSVTFGGAPETRLVPGLGASRRPELVDESYIDDVIHVPEADTIRACHILAARGFLLGGSTGTVVSGAIRWLQENHRKKVSTAVAISPDLGSKYLDTCYEESWLEKYFPDLAH
jgi:cysteine synthase A